MKTRTKNKTKKKTTKKPKKKKRQGWRRSKASLLYYLRIVFGIGIGNGCLDIGLTAKALVDDGTLYTALTNDD